MADILIDLKGISKAFGATQALDRVSFSIAEGSVHAVVGENGAGKSTLMKILSGILQADSGQVNIEARAVKITDPMVARSLGIGIVFQEIVLCPNLSILENLYLGRELISGMSMNYGEMRQRTRQVLSEVGLACSPDRPVETLTVAQKQLVQVARAILFNPRILILDEPTSALTQDGVDTLFRIIRGLSKGAAAEDRGRVTVIYISHKLEEIFAIADTVTVLKDGRHVNTVPVDSVTSNDLVQMMVGRELDLSHRAAGRPGEVMLQVKGLSGQGFQRIGIEVRAGEIVGIAGLVGAGRTELVETLFGIRRSWSGEINLLGESLAHTSIQHRIESGMALVPEDRQVSGLIFTMVLRENLTLPDVAQGALGRVRISARRERDIAGAGMQRMRIMASSMEAEMDSLSGGNQQKVVIAKWVSTLPKLLVMDDPTRGIDVGAKAEVHEFIRGLAREGRGVLMVSSELPELLSLCDRIYVMHEGELKGSMGSQEATEENIMSLAVGADACEQEEEAG
jgi:ribose transport system ATP-binding protein